jgi:hypothetical protein
MERLKCLTVPELRVVADRHDLSTTGKKQQLLTRLSIWVRDEIADGTGEYASEELETMIDDKEGEEPKPVEDGNNESYVEGENHDSLDDESSDESNEDVSSDEELELFGEQPTGKASNMTRVILVQSRIGPRWPKLPARFDLHSRNSLDMTISERARSGLCSVV